MEDYKIEKVVIKERPLKGKFAGGALGFKMEAAIQLIPDLEVSMMSSNQLKTTIKANPIASPFAETGLKIFQQQAFESAYALQMMMAYQSE